MTIWSKSVILAAAVAVSGAAIWFIERKRDFEDRLPPASSLDPKLFFQSTGMIRGAENPKYILMEFGDFECKPCAAASKDVKSLLEKYPETLAFTFRNLVNPQHPHSRQAALISLTNPNRQWEIHDALYELGGSLNPEVVDRIGKRAGFSPADTDKQDALLRADAEIAKAYEVGATPTFFLLSLKKDYKVYGPTTLDQVDWMIANNAG